MREVLTIKGHWPRDNRIGKAYWLQLITDFAQVGYNILDVQKSHIKDHVRVLVEPREPIGPVSKLIRGEIVHQPFHLREVK